MQHVALGQSQALACVVCRGVAAHVNVHVISKRLPSGQLQDTPTKRTRQTLPNGVLQDPTGAKLGKDTMLKGHLEGQLVL
jgi:hypothetical protein